MGEGGGVCQTDDVGQGGGSKKTVFARTSLMEDSYGFIQRLNSFSIVNMFLSQPLQPTDIPP